jgi:hypothetical protein
MVRSASEVSPVEASASHARALASASGSPRWRGPYRTSSSTLAPKSWSEGSWKRSPAPASTAWRGPAMGRPAT